MNKEKKTEFNDWFNFPNLAIFATLIFIIIYMVLMNFDNPNPLFSHEWRKDLEISFSSITSIGALFWSMYAVRKYWKFANFERLIEKVFDDINKFRKKFKKMGKLFNIPGIKEIVAMFQPRGSKPQKDPEELIRKLKDDGNN